MTRTPADPGSPPAAAPLARPAGRATPLPAGALALLLFGLLLVLGIWVTVTSRVGVEQAEAVQAEIDKNANLALAIEVQTEQQLRTIDRYLQLMRHQAEHVPPRVPLSELLAPALSGTASITLIAVIDEHGEPVDTLSEFTPTNAADRPVFISHRDSPSRDLLVSPPIFGRISGRWVITLSRRVDKPDGSFGGAVVISLEPRYLTSLFEETALGPMDVISQVLDSGITLARRRGAEISFGEDISGSLLMTEFAQRPVGTYIGPGGVDGHDRIFAYRKVNGLPIVATVGTSREATVAPVEARARNYYLVSTLVSIAIATVCLVGAGLLVRQQRVNRRLQEQASLLDEAQDAIMVSGVDARLTYWNRGAERLFGWRAAEVLGKTVAEVLHADDPAAVEVARAQAERTGTWLGELHPTSREGRRVITQSRWTLVRDAAGQPISLLTIDTDITEKRQLEQQFYRAQRLESIGTLAGGIAHDLNNVLAPIMLANDILYDQAQDDDTRELLARIGDSARRGAQMVRQVLSFARGQGGLPTQVPVAPLVEGVVRIARDTLPKSIEVVASVAPDLPPLVGDETQFHQVLLNLCVNARDAMPNGGRLSISAALVNLPTLTEPLDDGRTSAGAYVVLEVEDTGDGIAAADLDRIFDPFFTTKAPGKGTGLGLSTSLTIVKNHGGQIRVYSEPGRGTQFRVYLPTEAPAVDAAARPSVDVTRKGDGELVLFVDDEPTIRRVARHALEASGYRVLVAANGAEALAVYREQGHAIAIVITDMMMPVMGGDGLIRELQRLNPEAKIIAASGISTNETLARDAGLPDACFLAKPFTAATLLRALSQVLGPPRA